MGKFVIKKDSADQYRFNLKAANGEIILSSEAYTTKQNCHNGIQSVKSNAPDDNNYQRLTAKDKSPYFNLIAQNGQVIGTSEMYSSNAARDNGIESVKNNAPDATIEDLS
tara:strand:- start:4883 stop:5212 length:330 start_codon:yes stop_codon:yes gene_type:complete